MPPGPALAPCPQRSTSGAEPIAKIGSALISHNDRQYVCLAPKPTRLIVMAAPSVAQGGDLALIDLVLDDCRDLSLGKAATLGLRGAQARNGAGEMLASAASRTAPPGPEPPPRCGCRPVQTATLPRQLGRVR